MYDSMKDLNVFTKAYKLSLEVHRRSLKFPAVEQKELASQLRRASKSICSNLIEGKGKQQSDRELCRFVNIGIGSNDEVKLWLTYARDLGYINEAEFRHWREGYEEVGDAVRFETAPTAIYLKHEA